MCMYNNVYMHMHAHRHMIIISTDQNLHYCILYCIAYSPKYYVFLTNTVHRPSMYIPVTRGLSQYINIYITSIKIPMLKIRWSRDRLIFKHLKWESLYLERRSLYREGTRSVNMMTPWHGNAFRITGHLWGESPVHRFLSQPGPVTRSFGAFFVIRFTS